MKKILSLLITLLAIIVNVSVVQGASYNDSYSNSYNYNNNTSYGNNGYFRTTYSNTSNRDYTYNRYNNNNNNYSNTNYNNTNYNNNNRYNDYNSFNKSCNSWTYRWYRYPRLSNGEVYNTSKGSTRVTLACNNGYMTIRHSSNTYNSYDYYTASSRYCNAGRYKWFSHPRLKDWKVYTSKNSDSKARLVCNNGRITIQKVTTTYDDRYDSNDYYGVNNYDYYNDSYDRGSCIAWTYSATTYPRLLNGHTYNKSLYITWWKASVTLKCRNGRISVTKKLVTCNNWYSKYWNTCKREVLHRTCSSWYILWAYHPRLTNGTRYTITTRNSYWRENRAIECRNWNIRLLDERIYY